MESKVAKVLCAVAAFHGLLSAVLGFAAEATKDKRSDIIPDIANNVCLYSSPAYALGFGSAFILLVAFIIVNLVSGCLCCYTRHDKHPPSTPRHDCNLGALLCFILSWITFVVGIILMLVAAVKSTTAANMEKPSSSFYGDTIYSCYSASTLRPGIFASAACLSLISIVLGITCSLNLAGGQSAGHTAQAQGGGGIALGQPQVPPPMQHAGFAYEDTYARR